MTRLGCMLLLLAASILAFAASSQAVCSSLDPDDISCAQEIADTLLVLQDEVYKTSSKMKVVMLVDEGGLRPDQYYWTSQLLKILSEIFVVSRSHTMFSLVTYGTTDRVIVSMDSQADACSLMRNLTSMTFSSGESYLQKGLESARRQFDSVTDDAVTVELTLLFTTAQWRNLGNDPRTYVQLVKSGNAGVKSYLAVVVLKSPDDELGLLRKVVAAFSSDYNSKQLSYMVDLSSTYLRQLQDIVQYNKATGVYWPLTLQADKARCLGDGRTCLSSDTCVCDTRTVLREYICINPADQDPPEAVKCQGPSSSVIYTQRGNNATIVTWPPIVFSDNSEDVLTTQTNMIPGLYQPGKYDVVSTATDKSGNSGKCHFTFEVVSA